MKPKKYYYMNRDGSMRYRVAEPSRRRRRGMKSPAKLGGALAILALVAAIAALLVLGGGEVAEAPAPTATPTPAATAAGFEDVDAADIGRALWADFIDAAPTPAAHPEDVPEDELIATPTPEPTEEPDLPEEAPLLESLRR